MKKRFIATILATVISVATFTGCGSADTKEIIEVKNGFLDISVEEFEKDFNAQLDGEYITAQLQKGVADDKYSYYSCNLEKGIQLSLLATPDATMLYTADLSCDLLAEDDAASNLGYYYAKLMYTVAPDITSDEIKSIADELDMSLPVPGDNNVTMRNNLIYSLNVEDDLTIHLSVVAHKQ